MMCSSMLKGLDSPGATLNSYWIGEVASLYKYMEVECF